jgi:ubiquinone/menaquinone biosynthesis C-methylase UbiE
VNQPILLERSMNRLEHWFCESAYWRYLTRRHVLPWMLQGTDLGDHVLELGAGTGTATMELARLSPRVTSLEYDHKSVASLAVRTSGTNSCAVRGDASVLPFADRTFSSAIAILMLHHLNSRESQDRAFAEIFRVLRPGGVFLAAEIQNSWLHRVVHIKSTFVPLNPASALARLTANGFSNGTVDFQSGGFRIRAFRPRQS